jgi:hypothetical protein
MSAPTRLRALKDRAWQRGFILQRASNRIAAAYGMPCLYLLLKIDERPEWMWRACDLHTTSVTIGSLDQIEGHLKELLFSEANARGEREHPGSGLLFSYRRIRSRNT